jgi:GalNAc-alpha-(1->4)-GalNAc-alpha-(1->3)-diNAcBac-PP-undecaprenol alpha-1,4-N-acetyl-D-galactosaminyltransferase
LENKVHYELDSNVIIHYPDYNLKDVSKAVVFFKAFHFLRKSLKQIGPNILISFGGKYNSFVLLAAKGLNINSFISNRSMPGIKYGFIQNIANPYLYRLAKGIISQTEMAKDYISKSTNHKNIVVIPNPIFKQSIDLTARENTILNVGRFVKSKQQHILIDIFIKLNPKGWKLEFAGDGDDYFEYCKQKVREANFEDRIFFHGNQKDIWKFYQKSKIFAFTSNSEGFPNALAEAMSLGCACISFDCPAGPADIIKNEENGFLIENNNIASFSNHLKKMIDSEEIINEFSKKGIAFSTNFDVSAIAQKYYNFITKK